MTLGMTNSGRSLCAQWWPHIRRNRQRIESGLSPLRASRVLREHRIQSTWRWGCVRHLDVFRRFGRHQGHFAIARPNTDSPADCRWKCHCDGTRTGDRRTEVHDISRTRFDGPSRLGFCRSDKGGIESNLRVNVRVLAFFGLCVRRGTCHDVVSNKRFRPDRCSRPGTPELGTMFARYARLC